MALLEISHADIIYQTEKSETEAVRDLTLSVDEGEFIALVGPSGCGKTTLLSMIAGLLAPTNGTVAIDGTPVVASSGNVGYMLQRDNLFEWRTIESNVLLGLSVQKKLIDEPFSAVDFQTRMTVCDDVHSIIKHEKKTAVLVTHDIAEAVSMADRIVVLTARPATVKTVFDIDIDAPTPLKRRENPRFSYWFDRVWKEVTL